MKKSEIEERAANFRKASINFNKDERVRNLLIELGKIHDEYASEFKEDFCYLIEQLESYDTYSIPDAFGIFAIKNDQSRFFEQEDYEYKDNFWESVTEIMIENYEDEDED
jgi:hypothetical protein